MKIENRKHIDKPEPKPVLADVAEARGIEFKAWDKKEQRLFDVYGLGVDFVTENTFDGVDEGVNCFSGDEFKERIVIMQFTGFLDKNGNKIFEGFNLGDWTKTDEGLKQSKQQVFWKDGAWRIDFSANQDKSWYDYLKNDLEDFDYEIVGHIYECKV
ncbi:hypothetical protein I5M32_16340 [Pedobacter sp. SD-b]|uniref:YopX protein domain-containing protein n=1 Tax=Pedobacter segetis TaxID=2793069 RepID=A0ABS1BNR6_9SPHI|nr:YopX family protein [Pedobacter segetis]MBK0384532.1 hypothetical protein [Pedobacter segetis]